MKNNHKLIVKITVVVLLITMLVAFTQCAPNSKQIGGTTKTASKTATNLYTPPPLVQENLDEGQIINQAQVSEGIKSHEQILGTMSELTGVSIMNASVKGVYDQVATTLPTDNDIKVFLPPHQLAITKLAAEYCKVLIDTTTIPTGKTISLRAQIWPTFNFGALPAAAFTESNREVLIEEVIEAFWGGVTSAEEKAAAIDELHQLIDDLLLNEPSTTATTRNIVKGVCTSVLASAHVTLL
jgi:hypothetical protein